MGRQRKPRPEKPTLFSFKVGDKVTCKSDDKREMPGEVELSNDTQCVLKVPGGYITMTAMSDVTIHGKTITFHG